MRRANAQIRLNEATALMLRSCSASAGSMTMMNGDITDEDE
jgi:hypothetical protein